MAQPMKTVPAPKPTPPTPVPHILPAQPAAPGGQFVGPHSNEGPRGGGGRQGAVD
jgi:hypothetical protein